MEWGPHEDFLQRRYEEGKETKALERKPDLRPSLVGFYTAFNMLNLSRDGMGGGIPITEIIAYLDVYNIWNRDERIEFVEIIKAMDRAFLEHQKEEIKHGSSNNTH